MSAKASKIALAAVGVGLSLVLVAAPMASSLFNQPGYVGASAAEEIKKGYEQAGGTEGDSLPNIVGTVINTMLFIVGVLAVAMIIYSGIRYITAHGDKGQVESAKNTLIYSIVGLIIAIVAYAIVNWVIDLFSGGSSGGTSTSGGSASDPATGTVSYVIER